MKNYFISLCVLSMLSYNNFISLNTFGVNFLFINTNLSNYLLNYYLLFKFKEFIYLSYKQYIVL